MWDRLITEIARRPWTSSARFLMFCLIVVGLIEAQQILSELLGETWASFFVLGIVLCAAMLLFAGPLMHAFSPYVRSQTFGYTYAFVEQHWHLAQDGSRKVTVTRDSVFHRKPTDEELCDILFGSLGLTVEMLEYASPDAIIDRIDQSRTDAIKIFWHPKSGPIEIGQLYRHICSWTYPKGDTPYEKSFTIASRVHCNDFRLRVTTDRPIRDVDVRKDVGETKFWDNLRIFGLRTPSYVGLIDERTEKELVVKKRGLEPGETYFVLLYV